MQIRCLSAKLLLVLAVVFPGPIAGAEIVQPRGLIRESAVVPFAAPGQAPLNLDGLVTRPAVAGRSPLVVINHGSPRSSADVVGTTPGWANNIANEFARRGSAVAVVTRRGYGHSEGHYAESYGTCERADYTHARLASAADIRQIIGYFRAQPYVDADRMLVAGVSAGGFASIATASLAPPGVIGALNFAGGRGSPSADRVCSPDAPFEPTARPRVCRHSGFMRKMINSSRRSLPAGCLPRFATPAAWGSSRSRRRSAATAMR
jgi:dienelactone hydrolase